MELPPGWRGYGQKDRIEHPETAKRAAQVDQINAHAENNNRYHTQEKLMPFRHMLPESLQGHNQRLTEENS